MVDQKSHFGYNTCIETKKEQQMNNPIPHSGFFATADSFDALNDYVSQFNGAELRVAMLVMMMTMNTCNKVVEESLTQTA